MIMLVLSAVLTVLSVGVAVAQVPTGDEEILPAGARLEVLHEGAFFTEGAAVAPDGSVYFSDITFTFASGEPPEAGHILRYDPATGETSVFRSPSGMSNGLKFDAQGRLLACEGADHGGRRVTRTDLTTGKAVILASHYNGFRLNAPNDLGGSTRHHSPRDMGLFTGGRRAGLHTDAGVANERRLRPRPHGEDALCDLRQYGLGRNRRAGQDRDESERVSAAATEIVLRTL